MQYPECAADKNTKAERGWLLRVDAHAGAAHAVLCNSGCAEELEAEHESNSHGVLAKDSNVPTIPIRVHEARELFALIFILSTSALIAAASNMPKKLVYFSDCDEAAPGTPFVDHMGTSSSPSGA